VIASILKNRSHSKKIQSVEFSKVFKTKINLCIIFPDDYSESFKLLSYLNQWNEYFVNCLFVFSEFSLPFFRNLVSENIETKSSINSIKLFADTTVLIFNEKIQLEIVDENNIVIVGKHKDNNFEIKPYPKNSLELLTILTQILEIPLTKKQIDLSIKSKRNPQKLILDLRNIINQNRSKKIVDFLKRNNEIIVIFTSERYFPRINFTYKIIQITNLNQFFELTNTNVFFISDRKKNLKLCNVCGIEVYNFKEVYKNPELIKLN